jgi:hypothetical protein
MSGEYMEAGHHTVAHLFSGQQGVVHEWKVDKRSDGECCLHCDHCESEVYGTSGRNWYVYHAPECTWLRSDPPFDAQGGAA